MNDQRDEHPSEEDAVEQRAAGGESGSADAAPADEADGATAITMPLDDAAPDSASADARTEVLSDADPKVAASTASEAPSTDPSGWPFGTGPVPASSATSSTEAPTSSWFASGAGVPTAVPATAASSSASTTASMPRPRVRAGAIVWGVLVLAFAAAVLLIDGTDAGRSTFDRWQASLTPAGWAVTGIVALGVIVLLIAGTSAIRRAQRRAAARQP